MRYAYVLHRREVFLQIFQGQLPCGARGLNGVIRVHLFIYIHSLRKRAVNTLASVRMCTHSHGPSLLETALSINIRCAGPY